MHESKSLLFGSAEHEHEVKGNYEGQITII